MAVAGAKECISLKYLGARIGRTGMGGEIHAQERSQLPVLGIWVDGGTFTKSGNNGSSWLETGTVF